MPSAFTHALVGAAAAQFLPKDYPRWRAAAVFALASALPDLDVAAFVLRIPYEHPFGHRGFAHSLLFALLLGAAAALLVVYTTGIRSNEKRRICWKPLLLVGFLVVATHGLLDAATNAGEGIGFFVPFHNDRYFFPYRPILTASVDPRDFFTRDGFRIFSSEIVWIWVPVVALSLLYQASRWIMRRPHVTPVDTRVEEPTGD